MRGKVDSVIESDMRLVLATFWTFFGSFYVLLFSFLKEYKIITIWGTGDLVAMFTQAYVHDSLSVTRKQIFKVIEIQIIFSIEQISSYILERSLFHKKRYLSINEGIIPKPIAANSTIGMERVKRKDNKIILPEARVILTHKQQVIFD